MTRAPEARRYSPGLYLFDAGKRYSRTKGVMLHLYLAGMEASGVASGKMDIALRSIENARRVRVLGSCIFGCVSESQYAGKSYALMEVRAEAVSSSVLGGLNQVGHE